MCGPKHERGVWQTHYKIYQINKAEVAWEFDEDDRGWNTKKNLNSAALWENKNIDQSSDGLMMWIVIPNYLDWGSGGRSISSGQLEKASRAGQDSAVSYSIRNDDDNDVTYGNYESILRQLITVISNCS